MNHNLRKAENELRQLEIELDSVSYNMGNVINLLNDGNKPELAAKMQTLQNTIDDLINGSEESSINDIINELEEDTESMDLDEEDIDDRDYETDNY